MAKRVKEALEEAAELGLKVLHEGFSEETSEVNPDDRWSRASTATSWSVDGIVLEKQYPDVTACFPVKKGDTVCLLYTVHSSGDSFGHDEDARINFIDVFKDEEKAEVAAKAIRNHNEWYRSFNGHHWPQLSAKKLKALAKKYKSPYSVDIVRENEKKMSVHAGWNGYFDTLSYVEVVNFVIDANKRRRY